MTQATETVQKPSARKILSQQSNLVNEPDALKQIRILAADAFDEIGWPGSRNEEWKYTSLLPYSILSLNAPDKSGSACAEKNALLTEMKANRIVIRNGRYDAGSSEIIDSKDKLEVVSISEFLSDDDKLKASGFNALLSKYTDPVAHLNTALFTAGVFVRIKKDKSPEHPLLIIYLNETAETPVLIQPRHLIVLEENTSANIVFNQSGKSNEYYNEAAEVYVGKSAIAHFQLIQDGPSDSYRIQSMEFSLAKESQLFCNTFTLGGKFNRNNLHARTDGENAHAELNGVYVCDEENLADNHLLISHDLPRCTSNQLFKGILTGKGKGVFNGKIYVALDAQQTNAFQSNKNIILSDDAIINTKPQLEIFADDVKCSHGATVGQLDEQALFYLEARGIAPQKAKAMLTLAFANDVVQKVNDASLREMIEHLLIERLHFNIDL